MMNMITTQKEILGSIKPLENLDKVNNSSSFCDNFFNAEKISCSISNHTVMNRNIVTGNCTVFQMSN